MDRRIARLLAAREPRRLGLFALLIFGLLHALRRADHDLFARVAVGRLIVLLGRVPDTDPFAYTPVKPLWFDHEWLAGFCFHALVRLGGDHALFLFAVLTAWATMLLLRSAQRKLSDHAASFVLLIFLFFAVSFIWSSVVRAQVFTYLFFAYLLFIAVRWRTVAPSPLLLITVPVVLAIWVNCHGGFVAGLGFLAVLSIVALFDDRLPARPIIIVSVASAAATLINPYGWRYLVFVFEAVTMPRELVIEWRPLPLASPSSLPFYICLILAVWSALKRKLPAEGLVLLIVTCFFALRSQRLTPFFYFLTAVYGAPALAVAKERLAAAHRERVRALARACWAAGLVSVIWGAFSLMLYFAAFRSFSLRYDRFPQAAIEFLRRNELKGRLLVHFNEGSYALWRLFPRFTVALDGRYEEVYPDATFLNVLGAYNYGPPLNLHYLREVEPDYILLFRQSVNMDHRRFDKKWYLIYEDSEAKILALQPKTSDTRPATQPIGVWDALDWRDAILKKRSQ